MSYIIFIHGWATTPDIWRYQVDYFSARYNILTVQRLYKSFPQSLERIVLEERPILIGWSYGGMLCIELMHRYLKHIKACILISTNVKFTTSSDYRYGQPPIILDKINRNLERAFDKQLLKTYELFFADTEVEKKNEFISLYRDRDLDREEIKFILRRLHRLDLRPFLPHIETPILIVHGTADKVCPIEAGRYLKRHIKGARIHEMKEVGHMPFFTHPERFNNILEGFLNNANF